MKNQIAIISILIIFSGCELIHIGTKKQAPIEINQKSPIGAILLFKTELDSNNVPAATQILAKGDGSMYLAIEKYDLYDEVARLGRMIGKKNITDTKTDSLNPQSYKFNIEFNYTKRIDFVTQKIDTAWYITKYSETALN